MNPIQINDVSYVHPDREPLFHNVCLSVPRGGKAALVGENGSGKSTLMRLAAGQLQPSAGSLCIASAPYYIPQHFGQYDGLTVAGALGIGPAIRALHAILSGDASDANYTSLDDRWDIEERAQAAVAGWGLGTLPLDYPLASLSGGEKTRVFLAGAALHDPEVILLDEPSNHLDADARRQLYDFISGSRAAMLVISHDRTLLDLLDPTYELGPDGITAYGGNYTFYKAQKQALIDALQGDVLEKRKALRAAQQTARQAAERKQRADVRGRDKQAREGQSRIMMRTMKDGAEASAARLKDTQTDKIAAIADELHDIRSRMPDPHGLKVKFRPVKPIHGRMLVEAEGMNFGYGDRMLWPGPLSFRIAEGERVAIQGSNGSGKTTLLKLILGRLEPSSGRIVRMPFTSMYIDQEYALLDDSLTVYEQAARHNPRNLPEHGIKTELHRFLLPAASWDKPCGALSGGEKMKLLFCCMLIGEAAPDVLVLDEPTNNLDIRSLEIVTSALEGYPGTLLVISHDGRFLEEIGVERRIAL